MRTNLTGTYRFNRPPSHLHLRKVRQSRSGSNGQVMSVHSTQRAQSHSAPAPARAALRMFGRLQLRRLLGKSERSMAWCVSEPANGRDMMLVLPRVQPVDANALRRWHTGMRLAGRLLHPELAAVVETGVQDGWPYALYDMQDEATLADKFSTKGMPGGEAATLMTRGLRGLAFAHEAGVAHHDLQPFLLLVTDSGAVRVAGLGVAAEMAALAMTDTQLRESAERSLDPNNAPALQRHRGAAERDVLACGLLLHQLLAGQPALEEVDLGLAIARLPPLGRDIVRLPWTLAQPVADPLRIIVNRATERQQRQRYRSARTLQRALEGWLQTADGSDAGPLALLTDKLRLAGVLPSSPGAAARAARLALMDRDRTFELAQVVLEDPALSFELLRLVNAAQVRSASAANAGPVLTVRRAIAMLGLDGMRRAALALRPWPGPLSESHAAELETLTKRCKRAAVLAQALRPAGYDAEVVHLITLLQNLGRLLLHYHFPDETQQIKRLMLPAPASRAGEPEDPGMTEEAAAYAVLGADIEAIGAAVVRQWGLGEATMTMIRRLPTATAVRMPDNDDEVLRAVSSCANEVLEAVGLPAARGIQALQRVAQRYARALNLSLRDLQDALQGLPMAGQTAITPEGGQPADPPAAPDRAEVASGPAAQRDPPETAVMASGGLRANAASRAARN